MDTFAPCGSLNGREGRAEAPPGWEHADLLASGPMNVPLSRKWTPQALGAVPSGTWAGARGRRASAHWAQGAP